MKKKHNFHATEIKTNKGLLHKFQHHKPLPYLVVLGIVICGNLDLSAQTINQTVIQGSSRSYHVTTDHGPSGYTYLWTVLPGSGIEIETPDKASTNITWTNSGTYTITLTEVNSSGNCTYENTYTVLVLGAAHLQFSEITSNGCAAIEQNIALKFEDASGNSPSSSYYPLLINYTMNGEARTKTFAFGDPLYITLSSTDRADQQPYASYELILILTDATANNSIVVMDLNIQHGNTVFDIPEINPIISD